MRFENVCIEALATAFPDEVWSSALIEEKLAPLYERLRLPAGRLELMTGIRERRVYPAGTRASEAGAAAGLAALGRSSVPREKFGLFVHSAVCRDMLEPSTASFSHRTVGLPETCQVFDVSNACLGFLNAMTLAAGMIESGQVEAALVVSGENGRPLVEQTIRTLLEAPLDRNGIKPFFANLTIGSGSVAAVLCHRSLVKGRAHRLVGGVARAATRFNDLCQGDSHGAEALQMQTDSEQLLVAGVGVARETWADFTAATGLKADDFQRFVTHQVGSAHRRKLYEMLGLDLTRDFSSFDRFGNVGSVSLPATLSLAVEAGAVREGDRVGLLGIGSGINCMMLAVEW